MFTWPQYNNIIKSKAIPYEIVDIVILAHSHELHRCDECLKQSCLVKIWAHSWNHSYLPVNAFFSWTIRGGPDFCGLRPYYPLFKTRQNLLLPFFASLMSAFAIYMRVNIKLLFFWGVYAFLNALINKITPAIYIIRVCDSTNTTRNATWCLCISGQSLQLWVETTDYYDISYLNGF